MEQKADAASALLLRPEVAAPLVSLSRSGLYQMIRTGEVPAVMVGGRIRIRRADLEAWVASLPASTVLPEEQGSPDASGEQELDRA